jgi:hypothetical protein
MKVSAISSVFIFFGFFLVSNTVSAAVSFSSFQVPAKNKITPISAPRSVTNTPGYTANQVNLEGFIEKVRQANKSNPEIDGIIGQIRKDVATSTDLMGKFLSQPSLIPLNKKVALEESKDSIASKIFSFFNPFRAKVASAFMGYPFGGPIFYTFYCTCSGSWLVWIGPTVSLATSNMVLDYYTGSQAYLNYNFPFTSYAMGKYTSTGASICYIYYGYGCTSIPLSRGMVTPMVGTSGI